MKEKLEAMGYEVDLQYAEDDVQTQVSQIENMIAADADCLVIAAVDSGALTTVEAQAKEKGIPIIAYDRLLMDTDAVSYYASFDNEGVGTAIGEYIKTAKDLDAAKAAGESYTIEFFMGSPDDNNAVLLHKGVMGVLQPYLDDGTLVCKTGRTSFDETCILRWSQETAQQWCENYLTGYYADEDLEVTIFQQIDTHLVVFRVHGHEHRACTPACKVQSLFRRRPISRRLYDHIKSFSPGQFFHLFLNVIIQGIQYIVCPHLYGPLPLRIHRFQHCHTSGPCFLQELSRHKTDSAASRHCCVLTDTDA